MSKYIIELDDRIKLVTSVGVTEHGVVYTTSDYVHNLEELNSDYINEHYGELQDDAYKRGFEDGRNVGIKDGMCEAWEAVRKITSSKEEGALSSCELKEIFGTYFVSDIIRGCTAQEVIDKIKSYEDGKKADSIEVGDEVEAAFGTAVVTYCEEESVGYLYSTGSTGFDEPRNVKKTGRHFDIASILEAMRQ